MIAFFSNFISEHQIPFSNAMFKKTNGNYRFVATEPMSELRKSQKFEDHTDSLGYVVKSYESEDGYKEALKLATESDVVIIGSAPEEFIKERLKHNKLTLRYGERYFKQGRWRILDPRVFLCHYKMDFTCRQKNVHMLCCGAYAAPDCRFILSYLNKTYKWAYFTDVKTIPLEDILEKKNSGKIKILWVSRFIKLKHPEEVINLAVKLKNMNYSFEIEMIGVGEQRGYYENQVKQKELEHVIKFGGPIGQKEVFLKMQEADIFLFTSDRQEGWGAVINEAMTNACSVVACREAGSVPFLINDGQNGLIYDKHGKNSMLSCVCKLLNNAEFRKHLQIEAYKTMQELWNADVASDRLLELIDCINTGKDIPYKDGPCSRA